MKNGQTVLFRFYKDIEMNYLLSEKYDPKSLFIVAAQS